MASSEVIRIVLDTNAVLHSVSRKSPYKIILEKLFAGRYEIYVTTDILLEYEEKTAEIFDRKTAELVIGSMLLLNHVKKIEVYYKFHLIASDKDDDKFIDCAFASNVHYLVSNDRHFNILKKTEFPKINIIKIDEFKTLLENL